MGYIKPKRNPAEGGHFYIKGGKTAPAKEGEKRGGTPTGGRRNKPKNIFRAKEEKELRRSGDTKGGTTLVSG